VGFTILSSEQGGGLMSIYDFSTSNAAGQVFSLAEFKGKVLIIVDMAPHGGKYGEMQELYDLYASEDVEILGIDLKQYPPTIQLREVLEENISADAHTLGASGSFSKYLIDRAGRVVGQYGRTVAAIELKEAIQKVL
jgi:glutathione peroxidase-family protein